MHMNVNGTGILKYEELIQSKSGNMLKPVKLISSLEDKLFHQRLVGKVKLIHSLQFDFMKPLDWGTGQSH